MYPVPTKEISQGLTDKSVGMFLKSTGKKREEIVLATKVCGRSERFTWMPRRDKGTTTAVTPEQIVDSVEASLQRLGTDYIDLLQIHWPGA
jgi:aryl-alcohol dehydrogenase-like predicted oxidoreductase